jgi:hypothetical protein
MKHKLKPEHEAILSDGLRRLLDDAIARREEFAAHSVPRPTADFTTKDMRRLTKRMLDRTVETEWSPEKHLRR